MGIGGPIIKWLEVPYVTQGGARAKAAEGPRARLSMPGSAADENFEYFGAY